VTEGPPSSHPSAARGKKSRGGGSAEKLTTNPPIVKGQFGGGDHSESGEGAQETKRRPQVPRGEPSSTKNMGRKRKGNKDGAGRLVRVPKTFKGQEPPPRKSLPKSSKKNGGGPRPNKNLRERPQIESTNDPTIGPNRVPKKRKAKRKKGLHETKEGEVSCWGRKKRQRGGSTLNSRGDQARRREIVTKQLLREGETGQPTGVSSRGTLKSPGTQVDQETRA